MRRKALFYFLLTLCIIWVLGCSTSSKQGNMGISSLGPANQFKFSDVPVPAGFKVVPQNSYSFESSGVRVGVLKYKGRADIEQVVNFFKEQMPMYNWNLLNIVEYGERILNFDRESETCIITLAPKGSAVEITVSVGPKSQVYKKSKQAVK